VKIESRAPERTATPTVSEHPGGRPEIRPTSIPPVAGFDRRRPAEPLGRRWLVILAVAVLILAAGITAALLR
jgi:hypothetical protein